MIRNKIQYKNKASTLISKGFMIIFVMIVLIIVYIAYTFIKLTSRVSIEKNDVLMLEYNYKTNNADNNDYNHKKKSLLSKQAYLNTEINALKASIELLQSSKDYLLVLRENQVNLKNNLQSQLLFKNEQNHDYSILYAKDEELKYVLRSIKELKKNIKIIKRNHNLKHNNSLSSIISRILTKEDEYDLLNKWLSSNSKKYQWELIYRKSESTHSLHAFHRQVDQYSNTISLLKLEDGSIIGGFTSLSWGGSGKQNDPNAFIFNLSNKIMYQTRNEQDAITTGSHIYILFGYHDLAVTFSTVVSFFPSLYGDQYSEIGGLTNGIKSQGLIEFEMFYLK